MGTVSLDIAQVPSKSLSGLLIQELTQSQRRKERVFTIGVQMSKDVQCTCMRVVLQTTNKEILHTLAALSDDGRRLLAEFLDSATFVEDQIGLRFLRNGQILDSLLILRHQFEGTMRYTFLPGA